MLGDNGKCKTCGCGLWEYGPDTQNCMIAVEGTAKMIHPPGLNRCWKGHGNYDHILALRRERQGAGN